jgi:alkylhydroperoxidase family enzyme
MRIPDWTPELAPRDTALVDAIKARRGGQFLNLDLALLWSEPLARGWNAMFRAIRQEFAVDAKLKELAICTVAKLTHATYEFGHHAPEFVKAGGDAKLLPLLDDPDAAAQNTAFDGGERLAIRYAIAMTRDVQVPAALFAELRGRFSETEIVELTAAIAGYNMVARFLEALQVNPES